MILRGCEYCPHSCCDVSKRIYSGCSIGEWVSDLIFEHSPGGIYLSSFILETTEWAPVASFLFGEESFVMRSLRGFIIEMMRIV